MKEVLEIGQRVVVRVEEAWLENWSVLNTYQGYEGDIEPPCFIIACTPRPYTGYGAEDRIVAYFPEGLECPDPGSVIVVERVQNIYWVDEQLGSRTCDRFMVLTD